MERRQNDNQNQNQQNHNSNSSYYSNYRGLPHDRRPNPDSLFQNTILGLNRLRINRSDSDRNSSINNIMIGGDLVSSVQNRTPNVVVQENLISRCDLVNSVQNRTPNVEVQENLTSRCDPVNPVRNRMRNAEIRENLTSRCDLVNSVRNPMPSVEVQENLTSRCDLLNPVQNRMPNVVEVQENLTSRCDLLNPVQNRMRNVAIRESLTSRCDYVSKCAMTVEGCECLQRMLAAEDGGLRGAILEKVAADLPILMVHEIGSLFVKALLVSCDERQINRVLESILVGNEFAFVYISNNYFGRKVIKTLIENLKTEAHQLIVTTVLETHISCFTNYKNGQNVLEFFIYTCNHNFSRMRLFNAMTNKCLAIAMNERGSITLQHIICPTFVKSDLISSLLNTIVVNSPILAEDKYGNYVIQHMVDANIEDVTKCIVEALMGRFCELAKSKVGSYVVQKCLEKCEQSEVVKIVVEFTNSSQLLSVAQDQFGNYVLQCALEQVCTPGCAEHYRNLVEGIKLHVSSLKYHVYGKNVIQKIHQLNINCMLQKKLYKLKSIFPS